MVAYRNHDFGAQALVCRRVSEEFPHDIIVAEEDAAELRRRENAMVLDQVTRYIRRIEPNATRRDICDWIDAGGKTPARRFWTLALGVTLREGATEATIAQAVDEMTALLRLDPNPTHASSAGDR